jgi:hypothetical protein
MTGFHMLVAAKWSRLILASGVEFIYLEIFEISVAAVLTKHRM